jgi:hypothetical protein
MSVEALQNVGSRSEMARNRRPDKGPNLKKYCTGDYMTYCGNLPPESPEVDRCFEKNMEQASA